MRTGANGSAQARTVPNPPPRICAADALETTSTNPPQLDTSTTTRQMIQNLPNRGKQTCSASAVRRKRTFLQILPTRRCSNNAAIAHTQPPEHRQDSLGFQKSMGIFRIFCLSRLLFSKRVRRQELHVSCLGSSTPAQTLTCFTWSLACTCR